MPILLFPYATTSAPTFPNTWSGDQTRRARVAVEFSPTTTPLQPPVFEDVTSSLREVTNCTRGRQRLLDRFETGTATYVLDNRTRLFDPSYTSGTYYGNLLPMRRWRHRVQYADARPLALRVTPTAYASTPDAVVSSVTGDLDARVKVSLDDWSSGSGQGLFCKGDGGANYSFEFNVTAAGNLEVFISQDGTTTPGGAHTSSTTVYSSGVADKGTVWLRFTVDLDDGAGNHVIVYYYSSNGTTWSQLGTTVTTAGAFANLKDSNAPLRVGVAPNVSQPSTGYFHYAELRSGIAGTIVAKFDPNDATNTSVTSFTASTGEVWTLISSPTWIDRSPTTSERFNGFAESYVQTYDLSNREATCTVTAADGFKVLALGKPSSPWVAQVQSTSTPISAWYRFSEAEAVVGMQDSSGNARDGIYSGSPTMLQPGLVTSDDNTCVIMSGGAYSYTDSVPPIANRLYAGIWFSTSASAAQTIFAYGDPSTGSLRAAIEMDAAGHVQWLWGVPAYNTIFRDTSISLFNDGETHYAEIWMKINADGSLTAVGSSIDGDPTVDETDDTVVLSTVPAVANRWCFGSRFGASNNFSGKLDEAVIWIDAPDTISPGYLAATMYGAGATPYLNDTTGARINRVLTFSGWPLADRDIDTGNSTLQAADFSFVSSLEHCQDVTLTEQGRFFVTRQGKVRFDQRQSTIGASTLYTFSEASTAVRYRDLMFSYDDSLIRNSVTAQRTAGGEVTVQDTTSVATFYTRTYQQSGLLYANDNQTRDFAQWIVNRFKDPALRVEAMTLVPQFDPDDIWLPALALEIGDLVTVSRTPQNLGNAISRDVLVEGSTERITEKGYVITFAISEADTSNYWILGDTTYSVLGTTTRLAF